MQKEPGAEEAQTQSEILPAGGAVPLGIPGLSLPSGYRDWPSKRI